MTYKATIIKPDGSYSAIFYSMYEAAQWLDQENKNLEDTTMIETYDEAGRKTDGFFYTKK